MSIHILWIGPHEEVIRRPYRDGSERFCFHCRKRQVFEYVVLSPVFDHTLPVNEWPTDAYYGPIRKVECSVCKTQDGDKFPGTWREWEE